MSNKPRLLIFCDWFFPAYKAGGPITSVANMVEHLHTVCEIYVFTSAYDLGSARHSIVEDHRQNCWLDYEGKAKVYYADSGHMHLFTIKKILTEINPDKIHLNSLFSKVFTLYPLLAISKSKRKKIVLAPRGMMGTYSLREKALKKRFFLNLARMLGLYKGILWHATSQKEALEIKTNFDAQARVTVLPNFSKKQSIIKSKILDQRPVKNRLHILFVGRISTIKNVEGFINILSLLPEDQQKDLEVRVVGPHEDEAYYLKCFEKSKKLKVHQFTWKGELSSEDISKEYIWAHLYVSSSLHENYGHSIAEAFLFGCPVLVSDQTPWSDIANYGIGYHLPLSQPLLFTQKITYFLQMDLETYRGYVERAYDYYSQHVLDSSLIDRYIQLLGENK